MVVGSWMERSRSFHADEGPPVSKRQRVLSGRTDEERMPLLLSSPRPRSPPRQKRQAYTKHQSTIIQGVLTLRLILSLDSFLTGAPYIDSRQSSLPEVPRRRHPPTSRTERYKRITSRLQSQSTSQTSAPGGAIRKLQTSRPGPYDRKPAYQDAESRLAALERHAETLQSQPSVSTQPQLPKYAWGDEEVSAELRRQ